MTTTAESVNIKVMDELLEQIDSFVYLGADVSACGEDVGKMWSVDWVKPEMSCINLTSCGRVRDFR